MIDPIDSDLDMKPGTLLWVAHMILTMDEEPLIAIAPATTIDPRDDMDGDIGRSVTSAFG